MGLIQGALRRPITVMVMVAAMLFFGIRSLNSIKVDIFPKMDLPVIYLSHPFNGYTPDQMEAFFGKQYINIMLFVNGLEKVETRNIQGLTLMKLTFYPGTNMAQAAAEVSAFANRIQAIFPQGSQPPFIIRFDASTLPVGQLVISSPDRTGNELGDLANTYVRSSFTSIPGLVSPPPMGGNIRAIEINVDPEKMRVHGITADQVVAAMRDYNQVAPAGNVRIGDLNYLTPTNATIRTMAEFEAIPLLRNNVQTLHLRDVATVTDGADVTASYAHVNGKRSVYMQITKSADASTMDVVNKLKAAIPKFQAQLPEDVSLSYEFDQSTYVVNAVTSLMAEGIIGAVLTGVMVLLFLGDPRGALIVILTIPASVVSGVLFLDLFGYTINIMTLSGLALAIGILVDESTVTIENIHQHLDMGKPKALAIWEACKEIALPKLLILLCILAVFAPAFTMGGIPGSLFLPLALAIGFSMVVSYLLSQTFVPVLANWLMKAHPAKHHADADKTELLHRADSDRNGQVDRFERLRLRFLRFLDRMMPRRRSISALYIVGALLLAGLLVSTIGRDVLPKVNAGQLQVRLIAPDGTRMEATEQRLIKAENALTELVGEDGIAITSAFVGNHPSLFSVNPIYLWMAGPHEAVLQAQLKDFHGDLDELKDRYRAKLAEVIPDTRVSFEIIALTERILSQGSSTPVEVRIASRLKPQNLEWARKVRNALDSIPYLRDVRIAQSTAYPAVRIDIDRERAAQLGLDVQQVLRVLTASTSSSRYTDKNIWVDQGPNLSYSVQVEIAESDMSSIDDLRQLPLMANATRPVLGDIATFTETVTNGQNDNLGAMPTMSVTANLHQMDLGTATRDVEQAIAGLGELPRGLAITPIGLGTILTETLDSLAGGLLVAIIVILLMLTANYQSFRTALVVLAAVPAVLLGALLLLVLTGSTLNLQSYMGIIMSVGVSIANSVLLVTNAEEIRKRTGDARAAAREAAALRLRPILMTSMAMVVGMLPMAIGHGEGGYQAAPLGRAVIGGLIASTAAVLFFLPLVFAWVMGKARTTSVSLDPEDPTSLVHTAPVA